MNILADLGHPGHYHLFKLLRKKITDSDNLFFTVRDKDITKNLLDIDKVKYFSRFKGFNSIFLKPFAIFIISIQILFYSKKFKIDLLLSGPGGTYTAIVSKFRDIPNLVLDDTDNASFQIIAAKNLDSTILTPINYSKALSDKQVRHNSYHEISYLHPSRFTPDKNVLRDLNVNGNEIFTIIRFVSWEANHDLGHIGLSLKNKILAVKLFERFGKVFISSESSLPEILKKYEFPLSSNKMHDCLFYSSLFFGESATMATESAVLGTPAIFFDNEGRCYTDEIELKYGLVYNFKETPNNQLKGIKKGMEILQNQSTDSSFYLRKSKKLLSEKEDMLEIIWSHINECRE